MDAIEETIARVIETLDAGTDETLDPDATLHPMLFGKERAAGPRTLDLDGLLVLVGVFVVAALGLPLGFLAPLAIVAIIVMIFALRRINAQHKSAGS